MPTEIKVKDAVEQIVHFIEEDAELNDIAQMFTEYVGDDVVRVVNNVMETYSDPYLNGERVKEAPKKPELTSEQVKAHLKTKGGFCPLCKSDDIEGTGTNNTDDDWHIESVRCNNCGAEWDDVYTLSDVELTEGPEDDLAE